MFQFLWDRQWLFWPAASLTYVAIGIVIGLVIYYRLQRHRYLEHECKKDGGEYCWCRGGPETDFLQTSWALGAALSFIIWPVILAGIVVYRLAICPIVFVVSKIVALYKRVGRLAHWDGKSIDNAAPAPIETSVEDEFRKRTGRKLGSEP